MDRYHRMLPASLAGAACLFFSGAAAPALAQSGSAIAAKGTPAGVAACVTCHGAKGEGNAAAGFPRLAALPPAYLVEQLDNFAAGRRQNPVMVPMAKLMTPAERKAVASYYGGLAAAPALASGKGPLKRSDNGAWLAMRGRWEDNLPACAQCHGQGGTGIGAAFPALAGQSSAYVAAQLRAFKTGTRPGGPLNLMKVIAAKLSDADIDAVAHHYGGTGTAPVAAAQRKGKQ